MAVRPKVAGVRRRASTAVAAIVVATLRIWATTLHLMPWTVLLVSVSDTNRVLLGSSLTGVL